MKIILKLSGFILFLFLISNISLYSQHLEQHKCGELDSTRIKHELALRGDNWGYSYDDLLADLGTWGDSPYVTVDFIGQSVQNRSLWELEITSSENPNDSKDIVYIHARTHPNEVQSFWVTEEMIKFLISEDTLAVKLREKCIFYIIPMYNPDGVELEYSRQNANQIDIESNWYSPNIQPEVLALRSRFMELMDSETPIKIALNMHSAVKCKRYFVFHHANGTSVDYTLIEKLFIDYVKSYFYEGIMPWNFLITWSGGTPEQYPESWWWLNHQENVMALTYEDGNCDEASDFDRTAFAILSGIGDYLGIKTPTSVDENALDNIYALEQNSPNPVNSSSSTSIEIKYKLPISQEINLELFNIEGRKIKTIDNGEKSTGWHSTYINSNDLKSGTYLYRLVTKGGVIVRRMVVL